MAERDDGFALNFLLLCWKRDGGPVQAERSPVYVELPPERGPEFEARKSLSADPDFSDLMAVSMSVMKLSNKMAIPGFSIVRFRGRIARDNDGVLMCAASSAVSRDHRDPELEALAKMLRDPEISISVKDPVLGLLELDPGSLRYDPELRWQKKKVMLEIDHGADFLPEPGALATARALWSDQDAWHERIASFAVERVLELYATEWKAKVKKPVDAAELRARLKLEGVRIMEGGKFTFLFASARVYLSQGLWISGDLANGPVKLEVD